MDCCTNVCCVGKHVGGSCYGEVLGIVAKDLHDLVGGCCADADGLIGCCAVSRVIVTCEEGTLGEYY